MNTKKYLKLREGLIKSLHMSYEGLEKNALDSLYEDNPFTTDKWQKAYMIFRNSREALLELHLLLGSPDSPFTPATGVAIFENSAYSTLECAGTNITLSALFPKYGDNVPDGIDNRISWPNTSTEIVKIDPISSILCDEYKVPEYKSMSFNRLAYIPQDLLRLYLMVKLDNNRPLVSWAEFEETMKA